MLLILHYEKYDQVCELKKTKVILFLITLSFCIFVSIISLIFLKMSKGEKPLKVIEIERPDDTIISYMMTYIIPILTTNFINKAEILVNIILFLLIGYLYIRLNLLYLNPLWSVVGYFSYRINSDVVVITNLEYIKLKFIKENQLNLKGFYIANDIFVAQKSNNGI
jgi:hypothetical protein